MKLFNIESWILFYRTYLGVIAMHFGVALFVLLGLTKNVTNCEHHQINDNIVVH